ncbi:MAG TPA: biotin-dependent carboxyltransferase family protein [Candidatus Tyrphobacter sp.]
MNANEIVVVRPGPSALVVDRGRFGYLGIGVSWCGAADLLALSIANRLVGNDGAAAAVEITFGGAAFCFGRRTRFALAGADCPASLDGERIATWSSHDAPAGSTLEIGASRCGVRTLLAVRGGIDVPQAMGSRTTDLAAGIGGLNGRRLATKDRLPVGAAPALAYAKALAVEPPDFYRERGQKVEIGMIPGGEQASFPKEAQAALWSMPWRVSPQSNRMACLLEGAPLSTRGVPEMRSHAVVPGVVQVPHSGLPLVLLCDAQTTGGYPKAGVIAEADLWKMAQVEPGVCVRFKPVTIEQSAAATRGIAAYLAAMENAIAAQSVQA